MTRVEGRPIGARIREVLQITDALGAATVRQICARMHDDVDDSNVSKYCSRAVGLQLMTVDRSVRPMLYRTAAGWRTLVDNRPGRECASQSQVFAESIVASAVRSQPNSVFALGALS